ncbi:uncharacterized protein EHS24_001618 [Apiotrichum porosum]|uniref:Uncharacterized protein n=1 Tax=Apiotrichum porosum TaxID=105984 RepID=A0A427XII3_9TREE|nr:uncharacterized protein EHS24_001618 [Apiotrichum porosum]RSH78719.1 hypothetical protein EHS24_001618 [Apiotrichum porosum]
MTTSNLPSTSSSSLAQALAAAKASAKATNSRVLALIENGTANVESIPSPSVFSNTALLAYDIDAHAPPAAAHPRARVAVPVPTSFTVDGELEEVLRNLVAQGVDLTSFNLDNDPMVIEEDAVSVANDATPPPLDLHLAAAAAAPVTPAAAPAAPQPDAYLHTLVTEYNTLLTAQATQLQTAHNANYLAAAHIRTQDAQMHTLTGSVASLQQLTVVLQDKLAQRDKLLAKAYEKNYKLFWDLRGVKDERDAMELRLARATASASTSSAGAGAKRRRVDDADDADDADGVAADEGPAEPDADADADADGDVDIDMDRVDDRSDLSCSDVSWDLEPEPGQEGSLPPSAAIVDMFADAASQ